MVTTVLTRMVARALLAPVLAVAAAVLVKGYADVGDGFAAGVIAALGILLQVVAFGREEVERTLPLRHAPTVALAGLSLAIVVVFVPWLLGDAPLEHRPGPGEDVVHLGTLEFLTAVAFDVGVCALVLGATVAILRTVMVEASEDEEVPS